MSNGEEKERAIDLFARHVSRGKVQFFKEAGIEFVMGKREGPYIWDISGEKRLIDCHSNGGVFNLGHRNPEIIETLTESMREFDIGNHHLISKQRALLAEKLYKLTPGNLEYTVFGVGGGEAIDLAIKVARGFTGRPNIISAIGGYHGHTGFALAAGDRKWYEPFGPMVPGFSQVPFNDIDALKGSLDSNTAAVILETIPATYGIEIPRNNYLEEVSKACRENATLLIIDEVQSGLGRTGKLWAIEHFSVTPDILVTGKGLSGGIYPITATCFRKELESVFDRDPFIHVSTFGGAEVGCPVALKVLEISSNADFLDQVNRKAAIFSRGFEKLKEKYPDTLVGLRQLGMMMGIELASPEMGPVFSKAAYESGFLAVYAYNNPSVVQLLPALNIPAELAEEIVARVDNALAILPAIMEALKK